MGSWICLGAKLLLEILYSIAYLGQYYLTSNKFFIENIGYRYLQRLSFTGIRIGDKSNVAEYEGHAKIYLPVLITALIIWHFLLDKIMKNPQSI